MCFLKFIYVLLKCLYLSIALRITKLQYSADSLKQTLFNMIRSKSLVNRYKHVSNNSRGMHCDDYELPFNFVNRQHATLKEKHFFEVISLPVYLK